MGCRREVLFQERQFAAEIIVTCVRFSLSSKAKRLSPHLRHLGGRNCLAWVPRPLASHSLPVPTGMPIRLHAASSCPQMIYFAYSLLILGSLCCLPRCDSVTACDKKTTKKTIREAASQKTSRIRSYTVSHRHTGH
jgi:hypothetical protein